MCKYCSNKHLNTLIEHTSVQQLAHLNSDYILDDLDIATDFFSYMAALQPLLDSDPTVLCISAWNDNGKRDLIDISANS